MITSELTIKGKDEAIMYIISIAEAFDITTEDLRDYI